MALSRYAKFLSLAQSHFVRRYNYPAAIETRRSFVENAICRSSDIVELSSEINAELIDDVVSPRALDHCDEDISYIVPDVKPTFNFAAYANTSPIIQKLAELGVDLSRVEKRRGALEFLLRHEFHQLEPHIRFLHDCGVDAHNLGSYITRNPFFFKTTIDDLNTRIRYLRAHSFGVADVARIVSNNPFWLMLSTKRIDIRLGHFQSKYSLSGQELRALAVKRPKLITCGFRTLNENDFAVREEMGFNDEETKSILLAKPALFMKNREKLVEIFDYVHNTMKLSHKMIVGEPNILTCRIEKLRQRYEYLVALGKAQFDPTMPLYVSPKALVSGTDLDFCNNVAKTTILTYNTYLKTL